MVLGVVVQPLVSSGADRPISAVDLALSSIKVLRGMPGLCFGGIGGGCVGDLPVNIVEMTVIHAIGVWGVDLPEWSGHSSMSRDVLQLRPLQLQYTILPFPMGRLSGR